MSEDMLKLAARCEAATYPAPDDAAAGELVEIRDAINRLVRGRPLDAYAPDWIGSLDAAMTLVPEGCKWGFDGHWNIARVYSYEYTGVHDGRYPIFEVEAATPALALCAAALKARASQGKD